jgi:hypothetical protein
LAAGGAVVDDIVDAAEDVEVAVELHRRVDAQAGPEVAAEVEGVNLEGEALFEQIHVEAEAAAALLDAVAQRQDEPLGVKEQPLGKLERDLEGTGQRHQIGGGGQRLAGVVGGGDGAAEVAGHPGVVDKLDLVVLVGAHLQPDLDGVFDVVALDVVLAAQADEGLKLADAAHQVRGVGGDLLDVVGDGVIDQEPPDGALALADVAGDVVDVAERVVERLDGGGELVEVLAQLGAGRVHLGGALADEIAQTFGDLADVGDRDLNIFGRGTRGDGANILGDAIDMLEQGRDRLGVLRHRVLDLARDVLDRPLRQPLHVAQDVAHNRQRLIDLIEDVAGGHRLDDVDDLIAALEGTVLDQLPRQRIGRLRRAGIDLQEVLAEQRAGLLVDDGVRPQLDIGPHAQADPRVGALQPALGNLADDQAGDLHPRLVNEAGGVAKQRPHHRTLLAAHALGNKAIGHCAQHHDEDGGQADFDRSAGGLHGCTPSLADIIHDQVFFVTRRHLHRAARLDELAQPLVATVAKLLGRAALQDDATVQRRDAIADAKRRGHVVADDDAGDAVLFGDIADHVIDVLGRNRVKSRRWLVVKQDLRLHHQRPRQPDTLALTAGQLRRKLAEQHLRQGQLVELGDGNLVQLGPRKKRRLRGLPRSSSPSVSGSPCSTSGKTMFSSTVRESNSAAY